LVRIHQHMTAENFNVLRDLWPQFSDEDNPFIPTLQGCVGDSESYLEHAAMYEAAGINLASYLVVGVGSVCRLQSSRAIGHLARGLVHLDLPLHWYGLKIAGLPYVWPNITSHDSQSWGVTARRMPRLDGCEHIRVRGRYQGQPSTCANCPRWAREWGESVDALGAHLAARLGVQMPLFTDTDLAATAGAR
jgi:hypothetical protein